MYTSKLAHTLFTPLCLLGLALALTPGSAQAAVVLNTDYTLGSGGSFTASGIGTGTATLTTSVTDINTSNTESFVITAVASIIGTPAASGSPTVAQNGFGIGVDGTSVSTNAEFDANAVSAEALTLSFSHMVTIDSIDTNWLNGVGQLHFDTPKGTVTVGAGNNGNQTWSLSSLPQYSDPTYPSITGVLIKPGESLTIRTQNSQTITALIESINLAIVPEPSLSALLACGILSFALRRKR